MKLKYPKDFKIQVLDFFKDSQSLKDIEELISNEDPSVIYYLTSDSSNPDTQKRLVSWYYDIWNMENSFSLEEMENTVIQVQSGIQPLTNELN